MFGGVNLKARLSLSGKAEERVLVFILKHVGAQKDFFFFFLWGVV